MKALLLNLVVLVGLMFSGNLLACLSDDDASYEQHTEYRQDDGSYWYVYIPVTNSTIHYVSVVSSEKEHNQTRVSEEDSSHECECCEYCRCTGCCADCALSTFATLALPLNVSPDFFFEGRISLFNVIYHSLSPSPIDHPPKPENSSLA